MNARNATHRYRYRLLDESGRIIRVANCVIPRTDEAVRMMNHRFGLPAAQSDAQIQGCVSDGECVLAPIIAIGGGGGAGGGFTGGGGGGTGGGSTGPGECMTGFGGYDLVQGCPGGGDYPDPGQPYSWDDGTGRPACERNANRNCVTRQLTQAEWDRFAARVAAIRETSTECAGAKQALTDALAQGPAAQRIRFWDGYDIEDGTQRYGQRLSDVQGPYVEYDSYWVWSTTEQATLIVHEGLHLYFYLHPHPTLSAGALHQYIYSIEDSCI